MRLAFNVRKFPKDWKWGQSMPEYSELYAVFKNGDDVRQDQMVIQMLTIMDTLLKKVKIDFKFTLYRTLACSNNDGILEFVSESKTVQQI